MSDVLVEKRKAPRYALILAAEVIDVARGTRVSGRTSDVSRLGCYIDTLNPVPRSSEIQLRITRRGEVFEATGRVAYVNPGCGMGVAFVAVPPEQQAILDAWLQNC